MTSHQGTFISHLRFRGMGILNLKQASRQLVLRLGSLHMHSPLGSTPGNTVGIASVDGACLCSPNIQDSDSF